VIRTPTEKQRAAARRNVRAAQRASASKQTPKHVGRDAHRGRRRAKRAVRRGDAPTRKELEAHARRLDIRGRSKMGKDELRRAIARAR
jgi:hypothetical protein